MGDTLELGRALRAYRSKGGRLFTFDDALGILRRGDRTSGDELLAGSPALFGARSGEDTLTLNTEKAQLLLQRVDVARAKPILAQGLALATRLSDEASPRRRVELMRVVAWFAAATGNALAADRALTAYATAFGAMLRDARGGIEDANLTCMRAEIAGLSNDVDGMIAPLRRCLTMPNGYPISALRIEAAFTRHTADPRIRTLAAEFVK